LQTKEIVQRHPAQSEPAPFENVDEVVLFVHFIERGLALPASDFLHGLLYYYGIQMWRNHPKYWAREL